MNWSHLPIALALLGCALASGRLAVGGVGAVEEPHSPVILRGTLVVDESRNHVLLGYSLRVETGTGRPPAIATYRLVTTNTKQASMLAAAVGRTIRVLGRVGERPDQIYLLVEALLEP